MAGVIQEGIYLLIQNGLVELLVFALVFAIVFGVLQNVQIFGEENDGGKRYNVLIALAFGALTVLPHFIAPGSSYDIIPVLEKALPQTMLVVLAVLGALILLGMFGWGSDVLNGWKPWIALISLGLVIWIFVGATNTVWRLPYWLGRDFVMVIVAVAVFGIVVWWVMSDSDSSNN